MASYNEQKIYSELDKISPEEMYQALQRIKDFIQKKLEVEQSQAEDRASDLQAKIQKINATN